MTWNYRLIKHSAHGHRIDGERIQREAWVAIHEVYYDAGSKPESVTAEPVTVFGGSAR